MTRRVRRGELQFARSGNRRGPVPRNRSGPKDGFKSDEGRWGTREIEITNVTITGPDGEAGHVFQSGDAIQVRMDVTSKEKITDFVFGLGLFNADNVCVYGTNTNLEEFQPTEIDGSGDRHVHDRQARSRRRHVSAGSGRAQGRRLSVRLPSPALHVPREVDASATSASIVPITRGRSEAESRFSDQK